MLGYRQVRGAYYSSTPAVDRKSLVIAGQPDFELDIDLFDAERHKFPYADGAFDLVLCGELVEHLLLDPMHLLFECHRILAEGGCLVFTTPNAASLHPVAAAGFQIEALFTGHIAGLTRDRHPGWLYAGLIGLE